MKRKYWVSIFFLALNVLILVVIGVFDTDFKEMVQIMSDLDLRWMGFATISMVLFWVLDGLVIHYIASSILGIKMFWDSVKVAVVGKYYNAITPWASGGKPSQMIYLIRSGLTSGQSGAILIIKSIAYQAVITLYGVGAFLLKSGEIKAFSPVLFWAALIGMVLHFGALILYFMMARHEDIIYKLVHWLLKFLKGSRFIKDPDKFMEKVHKNAEEFRKSFKLIKEKPGVLVVLSLITIGEMVFLLSIPYSIYRACGLNGGTFLSIVAVHTFLYLAVSLFPTPGGAGASEGGFYALFKMFFPPNMIFVALLTWRLISYYMTILVGFIMVLADSIRGIAPSN